MESEGDEPGLILFGHIFFSPGLLLASWSKANYAAEGQKATEASPLPPCSRVLENRTDGQNRLVPPERTLTKTWAEPVWAWNSSG